MNRKQFLEAVMAAFPAALRELGKSAQGLLHCEVAELRKYAEQAIRSGGEWQGERILGFLDEVLERADPELSNAIEVSFLEDLVLGPGGAFTWILSPRPNPACAEVRSCHARNGLLREGDNP